METKKCSKCKNILLISDFNISGKVDSKIYYRTYCKFCQKFYKKDYDTNNIEKSKSYRENHKDDSRKNKKNLTERNRKFIQQFKDGKVCMDCKITYPYYVLDFDHLHSKKENISYLIHGHSIKILLEEISKCDIVCSNCHRMRTQNRIIQSPVPLLMDNKNIVVRKRINVIKNYIKTQKSVPCMDCKITYPYYVMDFDHLKEKLFNISEMIYSLSFLKIKNEISKCSIVCSNCHRIRSNRKEVIVL